MSEGRTLLGVSAQVILGRDVSIIKYKGGDGKVLARRVIPGVRYGDAINIPFYADVSIAVNELCRFNLDGINLYLNSDCDA